MEARAWFERTRAACGPPQLFSEEFDAQQHQMRGNLPQAFVHALMSRRPRAWPSPPVEAARRSATAARTTLLRG